MMNEKLKRFFEYSPEGFPSLKDFIFLYYEEIHGKDIAETHTPRYMEHFQVLLDEMIGDMYDDGYGKGYSDGYNRGHTDGCNLHHGPDWPEY